MSDNAIPWRDIEKCLDGLRGVHGGFTAARRGLVTLPDGRVVFIKIGVDDRTKGWAKREVNAYQFLIRSGYPFIPKLLSVNDDKTGFALESLSDADGWDWSYVWTEERLAKTLEAMDWLAALPVGGSDRTYFSEEIISEDDDGWAPLAASEELQEVLTANLRAMGNTELANYLDVAAMAAKSAAFEFAGDTLVHNDLRADNCPWHAVRREVKLIDWNQLQLGDRRIDLAATLVHVHKSGLDVLEWCAPRLDADALHWMAGFFFYHASRPIWHGGPEHLRNMQLESAVIAYELWQQVS